LIRMRLVVKNQVIKVYKILFFIFLR
jgi:hypothetical protein